MTFANVRFNGRVPSHTVGNFYVIAIQDDTPQSEDATFVHDHTIATTPLRTAAPRASPCGASSSLQRRRPRERLLLTHLEPARGCRRAATS